MQRRRQAGEDEGSNQGREERAQGRRGRFLPRQARRRGLVYRDESGKRSVRVEGKARQGREVCGYGGGQRQEYQTQQTEEEGKRSLGPRPGHLIISPSPSLSAFRGHGTPGPASSSAGALRRQASFYPKPTL